MRCFEVACAHWVHDQMLPRKPNPIRRYTVCFTGHQSASASLCLWRRCRNAFSFIAQFRGDEHLQESFEVLRFSRRCKQRGFRARLDYDKDCPCNDWFLRRCHLAWHPALLSASPRPNKKSIPYNTIYYNTNKIQYNTIQYNTVRRNTCKNRQRKQANNMRQKHAKTTHKTTPQTSTI